MAPIATSDMRSSSPDITPKARRKRASSDFDEASDTGSSAVKSKRARFSAERGLEGSVDNDSIFEDGDSERNPVIDPEQRFDAIDEQQVEIDATQLVRDKYGGAHALHNVAAECAIIEEVVCTNFMCHEHLVVKIGPLINFIIGHNGSGKSAVLTALQLCLGGKATSTNRGQSLKDFIKRDKEWASLSVRIKNQGQGAYRPEEYGKSITVERHFARSGTSGFKIKNGMGRLMTTKRDDLENILDHFALQLDNPMNVLTQDMARQFLNNSTPSDKYKFFQKGTHLEQLDNDYQEVEAALEQIFAKTESITEDRKMLEKTYIRAKDKAKRVQNSQVLDQQIRKYTRQLAWQLVREEEEKLERRQNDIACVEAAIAEREAAVEQLANKLEEAERKKEYALQEVARCQEAMVPLTTKHGEVKEQFNEGRTSLLNIQHDQRQLGQSIKAAQRSIAKFEEDIEDEKQKLADKDNGQHARQLAEIENHRHERNEVAKELKQMDEEFMDLQSAARDAQTEFRPLEERMRANRQAVTEKEHQIRDLERGTHDWLKAYHPSLRNVLRDIENNKSKFREHPIGPIGKHITLLHPKWSSLLEKSFGSVLDSFAVTSKADQQVLSEIMRKAGYRGRVFIGSSRPFERALNEAPADKLSWLRALKIESELIRNLVVINQSAEQVVLIEDREEAVRYQTSNPKNVKAILTFQDGGRRGLRLAFGAGGGESAAPVDEFRGAARMQADKQNRINIEKANLDNLKRNLQDSEQSQRDAQRAAQEAGQEVRRKEREIKQQQAELQRLDEEIERLEDVLQDATPETGKIDALKDSLAEEEAALKMHEDQYTESEVERSEVGKRQKALMSELNEFNLEIEEAEAKIKKASLKSNHLESTRHNLVLEKNEAHANLRDAVEQKADAERAWQRQNTVVEEHVQQATTEFSDRVPIDDGETADSLEAKVKTLQEERKRAELELGGTREQIMQALLDAKRKYVASVERMKAHDNVIKTLKQALNTRRDRWEKFRSLIAIRAVAVFTHLLSERRFRGKLLVNHAAKTLDINIEPDITKKSAKGRQTKTLSGGEKSFSTICLLLALWEAMGSPIRCLDEFDVFMDNVNRDIAVRMMIDAARRSMGRQFILITPQGMANVDLAASDVKIHKMSDPERGQQALPFGRA